MKNYLRIWKKKGRVERILTCNDCSKDKPVAYRQMFDMKYWKDFCEDCYNKRYTREK